MVWLQELQWSTSTESAVFCSVIVIKCLIRRFFFLGGGYHGKVRKIRFERDSVLTEFETKFEAHRSLTDSLDCLSHPEGETAASPPSHLTAALPARSPRTDVLGYLRSQRNLTVHRSANQTQFTWHDIFLLFLLVLWCKRFHPAKWTVAGSLSPQE